jgi:hypothetical protein
MSWLFSQALVEEYLVDTSSNGEQSALLNGNPTQQAYCAPDKMTAFSRLSRFGMTYKPLTASRGEELLTLFRGGFHAPTFPQQEKEQESMEKPLECGEKWRASFTKYNPDLRSWKTHQCSLLEDLEPFLETWPQWGLMRNGECWEQQTLAQTTSETASGLSPNGVDSFHTPNTTGLDGGSASRKALRKRIEKLGAKGFGLGAMFHKKNQKTWPTPRSCSAMAATLTDQGQRFPNLETVMAHTDQATIGGKLNPTWVEWLMGWPLGWTDLKPLATDKCHSVPQQHGSFSVNNG